MGNSAFDPPNALGCRSRTTKGPALPVLSIFFPRLGPLIFGMRRTQSIYAPDNVELGELSQAQKKRCTQAELLDGEV
ncbi:MAG: hypothetical protein KDJ36_14635, partial [Hyphomicrobiaceae bacterium]|nr:hypothetical protein [Hyphomicrobiaceae bacterium]